MSVGRASGEGVRTLTGREGSNGAPVPGALAVDGSAEGLRLVAFAQLAQALAHAASVDEVSEAVREHLAESLGASFANLALVQSESGDVRIDNPVGLDPSIASRFRTLPRDASSPLTDAVRSGVAILVESPAENAQRYPHLSAEADALGLLALAAVPIEADGGVCGALGIGWTRPFLHLESLRTRLSSIAALVSGAIDRAQTADTQAALIAALQSILLPELPDRPGLDLAARYQPAGSGLGFGGDWYDVIAVDDHRTVVIVGDVVGHGIDAAARMVQLRSTLNAIVRLGVPLGEVFARATPVIGVEHQMIGTAVVAEVDRVAGSVRYVSSGHPPLVLVAPDGTPRLLDDVPSVVLGWSASTAPVGEAAFGPGSVLLAYTDGLIECRTEGMEPGLARVSADLATASSSGRSATDLADQILASAGDPAALTDDVALVTVRHLR